MKTVPSMTSRRSFIKGAVAAAVAAAIPVGDGVALQCIPHPSLEKLAITTEHMDGARMATALARTMMQTREVIGANILNKAFTHE